MDYPLLLEIGNTTLKLATVAADRSLRVTRYQTVESLLDDLDGNARPLLCAPIGRELSGTAMPPLQEKTLLRIITSGDFDEFIAGSYDTPETLGLDRILNLAGLSGDGIVISCGTAITVDARIGGRPVWGAIMPGFRTAAEGLHLRIPSLPRISLDSAVEFPARTSSQSVANGILLGTALAAQSLARNLMQSPAGLSQGGILPIQLTGGDGDLLRMLWSGEKPDVDDALLFRGMMKVRRW